MAETTQDPPPKRLVLVGGGHSHAIVLRELALRPLPHAQVTLVTDTDLAPYSGMVPGFVAGRYGHAEIHIDLRRLSAAAGAALVVEPAVGIDLEGRRLLLRSGASLPYDVLSLNVGITPDVQAVPGAVAHAVGVKPVQGLIDALRPLAPSSSVVVVGGGAGGAELVLALRARLGPAASLALVSDTDEVLTSHVPRVRRLIRRELEAKGIHLHLGAAAMRVEPRALVLANGRRVAFDRLFWATQARSSSWLGASGLAVTSDGSARVHATLQSVSHPDVFAAGDAAAIEGLSLPKSGVYAVREGKPLADNLRRRFAGEPLVPYSPQRHALALIGTGDGAAVASRDGYALRARWLWQVKDRIDRRFMAMFGPELAMKERR